MFLVMDLALALSTGVCMCVYGTEFGLKLSMCTTDQLTQLSCSNSSSGQMDNYSSAPILGASKAFKISMSVTYKPYRRRKSI